ncbi:DNA repair protein RecO [Bifidobacterium aquikefiri]|uniref:DNA repair protein RecO n=1 Tax=Bifidobacterium aquikefiri TaxID=1653207 RepID=UPI0039EB8420
MATYRDEGVILRTVKLGEADRIITIFTKMHGKVRAVAKGVRRTRSRFGGRLEPFMRADVLIAQGRNLDVISQAVSIATYADPICADYDAYMNSGVIVEAIDKIISTEHERSLDQYSLLVSALASMAKHRHNPKATGESYVMRALSLAGWSPRMDSCVVCGRHDDLGYFSVRMGGMMCRADRTPDARVIDELSISQMHALLSGDWPLLDSHDLTSKVDELVEEWGEYYLERPIRSLRLLDSNV